MQQCLVSVECLKAQCKGICQRTIAAEYTSPNSTTCIYHQCMVNPPTTHTYTYIRCTYIHTYIHVRTYIHTYIHIYMYIRTYIHTYIHTYFISRQLSPKSLTSLSRWEGDTIIHYDLQEAWWEVRKTMNLKQYDIPHWCNGQTTAQVWDWLALWNLCFIFIKYNHFGALVI